MHSQKQPCAAGKRTTARVGKPGRHLGTETSRALGAGLALVDQSPESILELQRSAGNAAVARRMAPPARHGHNPMCGHGASMKPSSDVRMPSHIVLGNGGKVSDPSDKFEREAEANAVRVMSAPAPVAAPLSGGGGTGGRQGAGGSVQQAYAGTAVRRTADGMAVQRAADDTVVQRAGKGNGAATMAPPTELSLMPGAKARAMGGDSGFVKYTLSSIGTDPSPLYRGMGKSEFDGLHSGKLPQGASYQGFSESRSYSEKIISGSAESATHLVEFYLPEGSPLTSVDAMLKGAGAGEKPEKGIMSTGTGEKALYPAAVLTTTRSNKKLEQKKNEVQAKIEKARAELAKDPKNKHANTRLQKAEKELSGLGEPGHPAIGDAVKALNQAIATGQVRWRLVAFKTTYQGS